MTKKFFDLKFVWYFRVLTNDFIFLIMDEISIKKCFEEEINRILFDEKFQEIYCICAGSLYAVFAVRRGICRRSGRTHDI